MGRLLALVDVALKEGAVNVGGHVYRALNGGHQHVRLVVDLDHRILEGAEFWLLLEHRRRTGSPKFRGRHGPASGLRRVHVEGGVLAVDGGVEGGKFGLFS